MESTRKVLRHRYRLIWIIAVLAVVALGYLLLRRVPQAPVPKTEEQVTPQQATVQMWTCAMHPQIRSPKPGRCPICGMELIPVTSGEAKQGTVGARQLALTPEAIKLAGIEVAPVERKLVSVTIRMVGKIQYDEARLAYITARVPGRLDRLYVDYTGVPIRKGDHVVSIYSPELFSAQEELLQALKAVKDVEQSRLSSIKETARQTVDAVREKLRLWGLTKEQIDEIEKSGKSSDHMTIYAPIGGTVIRKDALEGMYVETGMQLYTIADFSTVWAKLDAYESDLAWLKYGQEVEIQTEAYPGDVFKGRIAFIDPVLDAQTRTVKVRVNVPNSDSKLKPEMFVHAQVRSSVAAGGKVLDPKLAGKWMCPMHPEIVKAQPGTCDICGMPLEKAESLGFVSAQVLKGEKVPLVIPATAPLITGKRAVVYVQVPGKEGTFEGREIVLGPRAGDFYVVRDGLRESELVVVNGAFKIDSALQILAKPSMMNPEGGGPPPAHQHGGGTPSGPPGGSSPAGAPAPAVPGKIEPLGAFKTQLHTVYQAYLMVQEALANDDKEKAASTVETARRALDAVDMKLLEEEAHMFWMKHLAPLQKAVKEMTDAKTIEAIRAAFSPFSEELLAVVRAFGTGMNEPVYVLKCTMAFGGRGAVWLQKTSATRNPYFGKAMPQCGEVIETVPASESKPEGEHRHE